MAAGLFHSTSIIREGKFSHIWLSCKDHGANDVWTWRPEDDSRLVGVACGRRHAVALDEYGRVWTFRENKYGQLGRDIDDSKLDGTPRLVDGALGEKGSGCLDVMTAVAA